MIPWSFELFLPHIENIVKILLIHSYFQIYCQEFHPKGLRQRPLNSAFQQQLNLRLSLLKLIWEIYWKQISALTKNILKPSKTLFNKQNTPDRISKRLLVTSGSVLEIDYFRNMIFQDSASQPIHLDCQPNSVKFLLFF